MRGGGLRGEHLLSGLEDGEVVFAGGGLDRVVVRPLARHVLDPARGSNVHRRINVAFPASPGDDLCTSIGV